MKRHNILHLSSSYGLSLTTNFCRLVMLAQGVFLDSCRAFMEVIQYNGYCLSLEVRYIQGLVGSNACQGYAEDYHNYCSRK